MAKSVSLSLAPFANENATEVAEEDGHLGSCDTSPRFLLRLNSLGVYFGG